MLHSEPTTDVLKILFQQSLSNRSFFCVGWTKPQNWAHNALEESLKYLVDEVLEGLLQSLLEDLRVLEVSLHNVVEAFVERNEIEHELVLLVGAPT